MNPSPEAITALRAHVADWALTDAAITAALNAPAVANPAAQGTVPRVLYESELAALLTDETNGSLVKLLNWVNFALVKQDIEAQNRVGVAMWAGKLQLLGIVTGTEAQAIQAYAMTPVPDPAYRAQIGWAESVLGRVVDSEDVAAARPGA